MLNAYIYDGLRTPIGRHAGKLATIRPDDLAAGVIAEVVKRNAIKAEEISDVILGCVTQAGEDSRNVARFASELGTIEIDFSTDTVKRYLVSEKNWQTTGVPQGYSYEQCYVDEIGLFVRCISGQAQWHNPVSQAIDIARVIDALQTSGEQAGMSV